MSDWVDYVEIFLLGYIMILRLLLLTLFFFFSCKSRNIDEMTPKAIGNFPPQTFCEKDENKNKVIENPISPALGNMTCTEKVKIKKRFKDSFETIDPYRGYLTPPNSAGYSYIYTYEDYSYYGSQVKKQYESLLQGDGSLKVFNYSYTVGSKDFQRANYFPKNYTLMAVDSTNHLYFENNHVKWKVLGQYEGFCEIKMTIRITTLDDVLLAYVRPQQSRNMQHQWIPLDISPTTGKGIKLHFDFDNPSEKKPTKHCAAKFNFYWGYDTSSLIDIYNISVNNYLERFYHLNTIFQDINTAYDAGKNINTIIEALSLLSSKSAEHNTKTHEDGTVSDNLHAISNRLKRISHSIKGAHEFVSRRLEHLIVELDTYTKNIQQEKTIESEKRLESLNQTVEFLIEMIQDLKESHNQNLYKKCINQDKLIRKAIGNVNFFCSAIELFKVDKISHGDSCRQKPQFFFNKHCLQLVD